MTRIHKSPSRHSIYATFKYASYALMLLVALSSFATKAQIINSPVQPLPENQPRSYVRAQALAQHLETQAFAQLCNIKLEKIIKMFLWNNLMLVRFLSFHNEPYPLIVAEISQMIVEPLALDPLINKLPLGTLIPYLPAESKLAKLSLDKFAKLIAAQNESISCDMIEFSKAANIKIDYQPKTNSLNFIDLSLKDFIVAVLIYVEEKLKI